MTTEEYSALTGAYTARVNAALEAALARRGDIPPLQLESMRYSLMAGGKRLRPVLTLAASEIAAVQDMESALCCACALEMIHTYSLIHDDLPGMDDDSLRRGKPTNHVVYGVGQAILAGDGLLSLAFETMLARAAELPAEQALRLVRAMERIASACGCGGMVAGQCADLAAEAGIAGGVPAEAGQGSAETLRYIHQNKTARMLIAPFEAACALGDASGECRRRLMGFARPFGLLFQVVDDYLDVCGDEGKLGKHTGKDQSSGKLTYVTQYGVAETLRIRDALVAEAEAALEGWPRGDYLRMTLREMALRDH